MLLYKQGRFYYDGISFILPDNFCLYTNIGVEYDNGIAFINPEQNIVVEQFICETNGDIKECFSNSIKEGNFSYIIPITEVTINRLSGWYCLHKNRKEQTFEVRLDVENNKEFSCCIYSRNGKNIVELMKQTVYKSIVEGIRKE